MTSLEANLRKCRSFFYRLVKDREGLALTEFAFTAPILLTLGVAGTETAHYVVTHMRLSQVATQVADNASRIGEQNVLVERRVFEHHINDMFVGADKLAVGLDLYEHGRVIVSSLEQNEDDGQWIHWQRCRGAKNYTSSYGVAGDGEEGTAFPGMGEPGQEIQASPGTAVMFVEVAYDYQPLSGISGLEGKTMIYTAAFNVRDVRDLSQVYQTDPPADVAACDEFTT